MFRPRPKSPDRALGHGQGKSRLWRTRLMRAMPVRDGSGLKPVGSMRGQSLFKCYRLTAAIDGLHEGKNGAPPLANPASGMAARRFPPPWTIDEMNNVCFIVRDKNGQQLGYFYFEEESPAHGCQYADQGRGAPVGGQLCEAAGAARKAILSARWRPHMTVLWRRDAAASVVKCRDARRTFAVNFAKLPELASCGRQWKTRHQAFTEPICPSDSVYKSGARNSWPSGAGGDYRLYSLPRWHAPC